MTKIVPLSPGRIALVSDESYDQISQYRWRSNQDGYAYARINGKSVLMHRFLMQPPPGLVVDHINRLRSDNRLCNLRNVTESVNMRNKTKHVSPWGRFHCLPFPTIREQMNQDQIIQTDLLLAIYLADIAA